MRCLVLEIGKAMAVIGAVATACGIGVRNGLAGAAFDCDTPEVACGRTAGGVCTDSCGSHVPDPARVCLRRMDVRSEPQGPENLAAAMLRLE